MFKIFPIGSDTFLPPSKHILAYTLKFSGYMGYFKMKDLSEFFNVWIFFGSLVFKYPY